MNLNKTQVKILIQLFSNCVFNLNFIWFIVKLWNQFSIIVMYNQSNWLKNIKILYMRWVFISIYCDLFRNYASTLFYLTRNAIKIEKLNNERKWFNSDKHEGITSETLIYNKHSRLSDIFMYQSNSYQSYKKSWLLKLQKTLAIA